MTIRDELSRAEFSGQVTYGWLDCFTFNPSGKRTRSCERILQRQAERLVERMERMINEIRQERKKKNVSIMAQRASMCQKYWAKQACPSWPGLADTLPIQPEWEGKVIAFLNMINEVEDEDENENIFDTIEARKSGGYSARKSLKRDYGDV